MRLVLHIMGKDFAFLRGRLATWLGVMAAKFAIGFWLVLAANVSDQGLLYVQGGVASLVATDAALTLLLAALLAQEDGVAGGDAFWRTRPIAGGRLLAAKVLGATLLLVVPAVAIAVPWWLVCGLGAGYTALAAVEVIVFQGVLILVAFTAGSVTDSLGRCFVWSLVGVGGCYGVASAWAYVMPKSMRATGNLSLVYHGGVILTVMVAAIVWQYLTHRRAIGLTLLLGGALVAPPVAMTLARYMAPGHASPATYEQERAELTRAVRVAWKTAQVYEGSRSGRLEQLVFGYEMSGVPAGHVVRGGTAWHELKWSGGESLPVKQGYVSGENYAGALAEMTVRHRTREGADAETRTVQVRSGVRFDRELLARVRNEPLDLAVKLQYQLARSEILMQVRAKPGPWRARQGRGLRIMRLDPADHAKKMIMLESEPMGMAEAAWRESLRPGVLRRTVDFLVESPDSPYPVMKTGQWFSSGVLGGVQVRRRSFEIDQRFFRDGGGGAKPAEESPVALTMVETTTVATFQREVSAAQIRSQ